VRIDVSLLPLFCGPKFVYEQEYYFLLLAANFSFFDPRILMNVQDYPQENPSILS